MNEEITIIKEILINFKPNWEFVRILNEITPPDGDKSYLQTKISNEKLDYNNIRFSQYFITNIGKKTKKSKNNTKKIIKNLINNDIFTVEIRPMGGGDEIESKIIFVSIKTRKILAEQG